MFEELPDLGGEDPNEGEREVNVPEPSTGLDDDSAFIERYSALDDAGVPHDAIMLRLG